MSSNSYNEDLLIKAVQKYAVEKGLTTGDTSSITGYADLFKDKISRLSQQEKQLLKQALGEAEAQRLEAILNEVK